MLIWGTEHHPVIVTGMRAPPPSDMPDLDWLRREGIPVRESKRGGLATYHGPGQLMLYCLVDLKRHRMSVPRFVTLLEGCVIDWLIDVHKKFKLTPETLYLTVYIIDSYLQSVSIQRGQL